MCALPPHRKSLQVPRASKRTDADETLDGCADFGAEIVSDDVASLNERVELTEMEGA